MNTKCKLGAYRLAHSALVAILLIFSFGNRAAAGTGGAPAQRVLWADKPVVIDLTKTNRPRMYYQRMWDSSVYPIGNGRLGCTIFGEPQKDQIQFNEDSLWVGNEPVQRRLALGRQRGLHRRISTVRRCLHRDAP